MDSRGFRLLRSLSLPLELFKQVLFRSGEGGSGGFGEEVVVVHGGEEALGVEDVGVVPLVGIEPGHGPALPAQLIHLIQVVHLCQNQVKVHHCLIELLPLPCIHPPQLPCHLG